MGRWLAIEVLGRQRGQHAERVFTYEGAPVRQLSTKAWYKALKRMGIADFKWHDPRHTWASWHVQAGTPLFALQELAGWESERMVRRYAHLAPTTVYKPEVGVLGAYESTTCSARQPCSQAHHGTITAHSIWARHIPGT